MTVGYRRTVSPQRTEHSGGFAVQRGGRYSYQYIEGERVASVYCEPGPPADLIYLASLAWDPPHDTEPLSDARRSEIIDRILAGLDFLDVAYETAR